MSSDSLPRSKDAQQPSMESAASQAPAPEHAVEAAEVSNEQELSKETQSAMAISSQQVQQMSTEQAFPFNNSQSTEQQQPRAPPITTIHNPPPPPAPAAMRPYYPPAGSPALIGTAAYGRSQARQALRHSYTRHQWDQLYKTVTQIAEDFEQDANTRRGFGLTAQEAGRDAEIYRWASLSEEDLQKIVKKPKSRREHGSFQTCRDDEGWDTSLDSLWLLTSGNT